MWTYGIYHLGIQPWLIRRLKGPYITIVVMDKDKNKKTLEEDNQKEELYM